MKEIQASEKEGRFHVWCTNGGRLVLQDVTAVEVESYFLQISIARTREAIASMLQEALERGPQPPRVRVEH